MKLLSKHEAQASIKKDNEELVDTNIRLRKYLKQITEKLNKIKEDYSPDKLQKLKEFEEFSADLMVKKGKLLKELSDIESAIEKKKEVYYGLIEKQDKLEEKIYQINQREAKLDIRENFLKELEKKQSELLKRM